MGKATFVRRIGGFTVTNKLARGESVNMREIGLLPELASDGLLCPSYAEGRFSRRLVCELNDCEPLGACVARIMDEATLFSVALEAIAAMRACVWNGLRLANLALEMHGVYLDCTRRRLLFIYWPITGSRRGFDAPTFFKALATGAKLEPSERTHIAEYMRFFEVARPFSIDQFDQLVLRMLEGSAMPADKGMPIRPGLADGQDAHFYFLHGLLGRLLASRPGDSQRHQEASRIGTPSGLGTWPQDGAGGGVGGVGGGAGGAGSAGGGAGSADSAGGGAGGVGSAGGGAGAGSADGNANGAGGADGSANGVGGVGGIASGSEIGAGRLAGIAAFPNDVIDDNKDRLTTPFLIRLRNTEIIPIMKDTLDIGRDRDAADYVIADNETVSRKHATLLIRNGRHYIIDNGSTNKTYVHDTEIPPFEEVEIVSGARIRLSSETFIFFK